MIRGWDASGKAICCIIETGYRSTYRGCVIGEERGNRSEHQDGRVVKTENRTSDARIDQQGPEIRPRARRAASRDGTGGDMVRFCWCARLLLVRLLQGSLLSLRVRHLLIALLQLASPRSTISTAMVAHQQHGRGDDEERKRDQKANEVEESKHQAQSRPLQHARTTAAAGAAHAAATIVGKERPAIQMKQRATTQIPP